MDNHFSPFPRVREAYAEKLGIVQTALVAKNIDTSSLNIFIRAFKTEKVLEIWGKNAMEAPYQLITTYEVCKNSGDLGPKRREGDYQVPEGFYHIDRFNPNSSYYLSLGLNYPNASDKILSDKDAPGSDIFIHGKCVTVGCFPMTDDKIKEIYLFAEFAKRAGQAEIPVHIFPFKMTEENLRYHTNLTKTYDSYASFWQNLKVGYDYFEKNKTIPPIKVDEKGEYLW
jgi:murein L,D-transpeptidase YafK